MYGTYKCLYICVDLFLIPVKCKDESWGSITRHSIITTVLYIIEC